MDNRSRSLEMNGSKVKQFKELDRSTKWRIAKRYALFQIPDLLTLPLILILIRRWIRFDLWILWAVLGLWVLKWFVLFRIGWRAYDVSWSRDRRSLIGMEGVVEKGLTPSGYIRVHGELWKAEAAGKGSVIKEGEKVSIRKVEGLTLIVERLTPEVDRKVPPKPRT